MLISGLQKLTLLDYPGKVACTVFTPGCNLRCPFCHNAPLVLPELVGQDTDEEQVLSFLRKRQGVLDGVAITGGEPLLHKDLPSFLEKVRALGFMIKLDTNGTFPERLMDVVSAGLVDRVAMDIKNSPQRYAETCGADVIEQVKKSAALLKNSNIDYEFRTTVCHPFHSPKCMEEIGRWLRNAKRYYIQPFVDSGNLLGSGISAMAKPELEALLSAVKPYIPAAELRGV